MSGDPHFRQDAAGDFFLGRHRVPPDMVSHVRFYLDHPALVLPHRHDTRDGLSLTELEVSCDACGQAVPADLVHGVINNFPSCIEVRFTAPCPQCSSGRPRILHNVLRFRGNGEMDFIRDGVWVRTTSWWKWFRHRLGF